MTALAALVVGFGAAVGLGDDPAPTGAGDPRATRGDDPTSTAPPGTTGRWTSDPLDQAVPVPGHQWAGWKDHPAGRCAWLPPDLLTALWAGTPQHPMPDALNRASACDLFHASTDDLDVLTHQPPAEESTAVGRTCDYLHGGTAVRLTLTHGPDQGLETTPTINPHHTRSRTLGLLPAREEHVSTGCAVTAEPIPGRTLRVTFYTDRHRERSCDTAELVAARSALRLLDSPR